MARSHIPRNIMDKALAEVERIYGIAMEEVMQIAHQDSHDVLLRRFSSKYGTLSIEEKLAIRQALGHQDNERTPCKACRIIARKEYDQAED